MRRKLIEQVIERACHIEFWSAGDTSQITSTAIDRQGFLSAHIVGQALSQTIANTQDFTFYVYDSDASTGTFSIYMSAVATFTVAPASSAVTTADGIDVDLSGADRYLKVYISVTGATTVTALVSAACILGDAVIEPAT